MTTSPINLELILDAAKIIENRACRDALLTAVGQYKGPSKETLSKALDLPEDVAWQPPFFAALRAAISQREPVEAIALAAFAGPAFLPAFLEIGTAMQALSSDLEAVRPLAAKQGLFENDRTLEYLCTHYDMLWHVFASMRLGRILDFKPYDPRRLLGNNGGALYEEEIQTKKLRACYTPTPTIGNEIAPELKAALRAMQKGAEFSCFSYVNLQNISSQDEGYRVEALMRLNEEFSGTFFGITLSQDSHFFYDEEAPALQMKEELLHPANFTLENRRRKNDPGYYFPGGLAEWEKPLLSIFDSAYAITQSKKALIELVHLGIIRYHQMSVLRRGSTLSTVACKESIDRGGKLNAELYWASTKENDTSNLIVFSMFHARALLARCRMILKHRSDEMSALLHEVPRRVAFQFLHDISLQFGVDSSKIRLL